MDNSETFTIEYVSKSLKSNTLSPEEKLKFAKKIWNISNKIFIPRRREMILEWICNTVLKSMPKKYYFKNIINISIIHFNFIFNKNC